MTKKSSKAKKPPPAPQVFQVAFKPVVWVGKSLSEAKTLRQSSLEALASALEKLVLMQRGVRLPSRNVHRYPDPKKGKKVLGITTGVAGHNSRIVVAEKNNQIYVLYVFHKQGNGISTAEINVIQSRWKLFEQMP